MLCYVSGYDILHCLLAEIYLKDEILLILLRVSRLPASECRNTADISNEILAIQKQGPVSSFAIFL
jgi:hypothetical protein